MRIKEIAVLFCFLLLAGAAFTQTQSRFSLATDFGAQRSFKETQKYWTVGQTIAGHLHLNARHGLYAWFTYYAPGKFRNEVNATAKDPLTIPQQIAYTNKARLSVAEISFGWKYFFKGSYDAKSKWNGYGLAGLGLLFGRVVNTHTVRADTNVYKLPVWQGKSSFNRLTLDLGLGIERPMGGDIFMYTEAKTLIPISYYPSNYLLNSKYAPLTASLSIGIRLLF